MKTRLFAFGAILVAASASAKEPDAVTAKVRTWRVGHERQILAEFTRLLAIPNVASDAANIGKNADAVAELFRKRGLAVELLKVSDAPPAVFAALDSPGAAKTITFYAHYDGQPTDPKEWTGAPWTPAMRTARLEDGGKEINPADLPTSIPPDWRLYGRSAGDDKAPIIGFATALDALKEAGIRPRVNIHFLFEGEEEAGSPHLAEILTRFKDRLRTDAWILCDGPVHQSGRAQIFFGARGTTDAEITVYGPNRGLHSGHYGNWAPNPISELTHLLDSMRDENGNILIADYSEHVRALTDAERRALAAVPRVDEDLRKAFAIGRTEGGGVPLIETIQRPAINVRGISGGHVGALASNTINTQATASIDFRLVPDQTPDEIKTLVEAHIAGQGYFVVHDAPDDDARRAHPKVARIDWNLGYPAWRTPMDLPFSKEVIRVVGLPKSEPPVVIPMLGGSIPMYLFAGSSNTPVVGVPIANYDDNQHAPNENLRIGNLWDGIEVYAELFAGLK